MLSVLNTVSFIGIEVKKIEVQAHISGGGLPSFNIVGLATKSIAESKERVRAAFSSIGLGLPAKRITINLAPADIVKDGSHFDLSIALALLAATEVISHEEVAKFLILGELSLDGTIRSVKGVLPAAIKANSIGLGVICPYDNSKEARFSGNKSIVPSKHILELINHFQGKDFIVCNEYQEIEENLHNSQAFVDFRDIKGQKQGKRIMEITAAGGHNLLMIGPPGSGKSMLAKRLPTILPKLTVEEKLEATIIASIAGTLDTNSGLVETRPFREPHSSSSMPAMIGGGQDAKPGEITLAHLGVLFLDELPEFSSKTLESLRQPLESKCVHIARVNNHIIYPAKFQLIAAMNPCKCGYFASKNINNMCKRVPQCGYDYQNRISGPLLDRFDLQIFIDSENYIDIKKETSEEIETSADIMKRINRARNKQLHRNGLFHGDYLNASLDGERLNKIIRLDSEADEILEKAIKRFYFSTRAINKILRVARTICDLEDGGDVISKYDVGEALQYRPQKI